MSCRRRRFWTRLGWAGVLVALLVGLPMVLLEFGEPFPRSLPDRDTVVRSLRQRDVRSGTVRLVLVSGLWLVWLQLLWATVWEIAVARPSGRENDEAGRSAPLVPSVLSGSVSRLVSGALSAALVAGMSQQAEPAGATERVPVLSAEPERSSIPARDRPDVDHPGPIGSGEGRSHDGLVLSVGTGLVALGLLDRLHRRRRFRAAGRPPGMVAAPPPADAVGVERLLRDERRRTGARAEWIRAALASLPPAAPQSGSGASGGAGAVPVWGRFDGHELRLILAAPIRTALPAPWQMREGGAVLVLPADAAPEVGSAGWPFPAMISVAEGVLVNLDQVGVLAFGGEAAEVEQMVAAALLELWACAPDRAVRVRSTVPVSGWIGSAPIEVEHPDRLAAELNDLGLQGRPATAVRGSVLQGEPEAFLPLTSTVLLVSSDHHDRIRPSLDWARAHGVPVAAVIAGSVASRAVWRIDAQPGDDRCVISPIGLVATRNRVSRRALAAVDTLLRDAVDGPRTPTAEIDSRMPSIRGDGVPTATATAAASAPAGVARAGLARDGAAPDGSARAATADEAAIEVQVLGPIEIVGSLPLTPQQRSLVAFLATEGGSGRETVVDALWDGQPISPSRFLNLLSETRNRLGRHHLPDAVDGNYRVEGIGTDLGRFERHLARSADGRSEPLTELTAALSLVRGVPFTAPTGRHWAWVGDHTHRAARVEAMVADAALELGRLAIDSSETCGDGGAALARWACERALLAVPLDESVVSMLTGLYIDGGYVTAAHRLVARWERAVRRLDCGEPPTGPRKRLRSLAAAARR